MSLKNLVRISIIRLTVLYLPEWRGNISKIFTWNTRKICNQHYLRNRGRILYNVAFAYSLSLFSLFNHDKELPEDKLITTIKQSILCIQREQYAKAEQLLHLALRMAQDLKSKDGITYIYDIMANLAMEREQLKKAEILFVDVLRRLLADGLNDDNLKILHISSKLAHIAQLKGDLEKARIGFIWTLAKIEECKKQMPDNIDVKELWGLTSNWFGQLLMEENNYKQAKDCFKNAYDCYVEIHGAGNDEAVTILNNLCVACINMDNCDEAKRHLLKALDILQSIKDTSQEGILLANLGLIYLREGLTKDAKSSCSQAWKCGKAQQNEAAIKQAEYCLSEINTYLQNHS